MPGVYAALRSVAFDFPGDTDSFPFQHFLGIFTEKVTLLYRYYNRKYLLWRWAFQEQVRSRVLGGLHIGSIDNLTAYDLILAYISPCFFGSERPGRLLRNGKGHREESDSASPLVTHTTQWYTLDEGKPTTRVLEIHAGPIVSLQSPPRIASRNPPAHGKSRLKHSGAAEDGKR